MAKGFGTIVRVVPAIDVQDISSSVGLLGVRTATGFARQDSRDSSVLRGRGVASVRWLGAGGDGRSCFAVLRGENERAKYRERRRERKRERGREREWKRIQYRSNSLTRV